MSCVFHSCVFLPLPPGTFLMGGIAEDKFVTSNELPVHLVTLPAFQLTAHPITRAQWHGTADIPHPHHPITRITFAQATAFAAKHQARLPSEAEWEYACRATTTTVFPSATHLTPADANFLYDESGTPIGPGTPTPVGQYPPNAFGLHDMLGNVCEWTADHWHPHYHHAPTDGSPWIEKTSTRRVIRGGAWDHLPRLLRASWRDWAPETASHDNLGLRLARPIPSASGSPLFPGSPGDFIANQQPSLMTSFKSAETLRTAEVAEKPFLIQNSVPSAVLSASA